MTYIVQFIFGYVNAEFVKREHLAKYIANPTARLLIARDRNADEKIVGVAIETMLSTETEILRQSANRRRVTKSSRKR